MPGLFSFPGTWLPPQIPTFEPTEFAAGETVQWRRSYDDYSPADGWALKYYFAGPELFSVVPSGATGEWIASIAPADTAAKTAGTYRWTLYAEKGVGPAERRRIASGTILLTANMSTAAPGDLVSFAERALPIVEAAITNQLTVDQQSFQIDGTAITKIPIVELKRIRSELRSELWRKRNPGKIGQPVLLRFGRA